MTIQILVVMFAVLLVAAAAPAVALEVGQPAPAFEMESTVGTIKLADYRGKKNVVLAFYFKDFTGG